MGESVMERIGATVDKIVSSALALVLLFMFTLIFLNVVLRYVFLTGLPIAEELARFGFLWTTFLGAFLAVREDRHIGITGLKGMIDSRHHRIIDRVTYALKVIILMVVLVGAYEIFIANIGGRSPVSGAPVAIGFLSIMTGSAILLTVFITRLYVLMVRSKRGTLQ